MRTIRSGAWWLAAACLLGMGGGAVGASAQERSELDTAADGVRRSPALTLSGGWFGAEADSIDAGPVVQLGLEFPLADWLVLRPAIARRTSTWPAGDRDEWILDFALQAERHLGALTPYAGISLGAAFDFRDERAFTEEFVIEAYGAMAGARWDFTRRIGLRAETHWRWLDGFEQGALGTTAGLAFRF